MWFKWLLLPVTAVTQTVTVKEAVSGMTARCCPDALTAKYSDSASVFNRILFCHELVKRVKSWTCILAQGLQEKWPVMCNNVHILKGQGFFCVFVRQWKLTNTCNTSDIVVVKANVTLDLYFEGLGPRV